LHLNQQPSQANPPIDTAYWAILASKGNMGETGATGSAGSDGADGANATLVLTFSLPGDAFVRATPPIHTFWADVAYTITECKLTCDTAPTGANLNVDVKKNGTTIFTGTPLYIAATATDSSAVTSFATSALAIGDKLSWVVTQVGSTVIGGNNLTLRVVLTVA